MRIIRSKVARDFTVMRNGWIRNTKLSAKAKGIFAYLLTLPDNWDLHIDELITHFTDGETAIRSGLKELISQNYIHCQELRDERGMLTGNEYFLIEDPDNPRLGNQDVDNKALLSTNIPSTNKKTIVDLAKYKLPIEVLNELTGRNFKLDNLTSLSNIRARVKEGSSLEEICEVIKFICKKRMGTEFEMYLRPSTVFNKTKYENYMAEYKFSLTNIVTCYEEDGKLVASTLKDLD